MVNLLIGAVLVVAVVASLLDDRLRETVIGVWPLPFVAVVVGALGVVTILKGITELLPARYGQSDA